MRKLLKISACTAGLILAASAYAFSWGGQSASEPKQTSSADDQVLLYKAAKSKDVIAKLSPASRLVLIIQKDQWIKVGNPQNGQVGWVNLTQYQQARNNFYRPDIQTVYISMSQSKNGKPTWNIIAYKNGKQLTSKEAKKLYKRWRSQQIAWQRNWQRNAWGMDNWMDQQLQQAQKTLDTAWGNAPWVEPIIVMPSLPPLHQSRPSNPKGTAVADERDSQR